MRLLPVMALVLFASVGLGAVGTQAAENNVRKAVVAELLEDDAEALLKKLTNPTGDPGQGHVENKVIFSGKAGIKIIPIQRFEPTIPGWRYRITEKPKPGEWRYLRFAWKADGCDGIMLQLHDEKDWYIRYTAGVNTFNWATKFVAGEPPRAWKLVTCDLFKDFGERTITGIALTAFGGQAAYFDHIYLGRTIEDLDRIDATGLRHGKPVDPTAKELEELWNELAGADDAKAYLAFWTLVAAPKQAVPFLERKLTPQKAPADGKQLRAWIRELDDDEFAVRERATQHLAENLEEARELLERELKQGPSVEVRSRIEHLLASPKHGSNDAERITKGVRVLEYLGTADSKQRLKALATGAPGSRVAKAAKAALDRLGTSSRTP